MTIEGSSVAVPSVRQRLYDVGSQGRLEHRDRWRGSGCDPGPCPGEFSYGL